MRKFNKITIVDIAKASGVSVSTVSRILNDKPDVAEETRRRVLQIIEEHGYTRQAQWQQLASGKSRVISLHYPQDYAVFTQLALDFIIGAAAACEEENYSLNLITRSLTESNLLGLYRSAQTDGVILMEIHALDWRVELLRSNQLPFVMIGHCDDNTRLSYIDLDFKAAVMAAIDHLVALGHCQIGFISIAPRLRQKKYTPTIRASAGYEEACHKYGLPKLFREANLVMQDIETATLSLLDEQPQITALVTANDVAAVAVLRAIHTLNLRIPEGISVVGLATDQIAQLITPPLTAINFPSRLMGYEAGKMLISRLEDVTDEIEQVFVPIELIVRSSTGPARSRV